MLTDNLHLSDTARTGDATSSRQRVSQSLSNLGAIQ
jgi:hypothetical protein